MTTKKLPAIMTPAEAGLVLGISGQRVRQMVDNGQLDAVKTVTGRRLVLAEGVERERIKRFAPNGARAASQRP